MKNSTSHLPDLKREELKKISNLIAENSRDVEKIILYGSYARGDYREEKDLKPDRKSGHASDYDILVITKKRRLALDASFWNKVSEKLQNLNLSASPRILTIDISAVNTKLAEGQYFYSDVKKEGILLFDTEDHELASQKDLPPQERKRIAQDHFDEWFFSSTEFFIGYDFYLKRGSLKKAAFSLHQAAENAYKTVLLVFSNHCPSEHFLELLEKSAKKYHKSMASIFTKNSEEDEARFKLLEYAYIGARYNPSYKITKQDLNLLAADVKKLLELTKEVCEERIGGF